jgi:hypothetical protein
MVGASTNDDILAAISGTRNCVRRSMTKQKEANINRIPNIFGKRSDLNNKYPRGSKYNPKEIVAIIYP